MKRLIAYLSAFFLCVNLYAQSWDTALDLYEQICHECIELRTRAASGEKVSSSAITNLLEQLSSLRKTLGEAQGRMNAAQVARYNRIKSRYEEAFESPRKALAAVFSDRPSFPVFLSPVPETGRPSPAPPRRSMSEISSGLRYGLLLYMNFPVFQPGVMGTFSAGRWGGFLKGGYSLGAPVADYTCFSDGTTPTGYIWTSGKERAKRYSITTGASYAATPFLSVYAGIGYGLRSLFWEDSSGKWAMVVDQSAKGLALDAGIVLTNRQLSFMTGISAISFKTLSAEVGIGFSF